MHKSIKGGKEIAIRALRKLGGIERLGPPYLIRIESPAEKIKTSRINPS
jgi:hypothetical protein